MARKHTPPPLDDAAIDDLLAQVHVDASGPSQLNGLSDDDWVKTSGWTPLEFLAHTYRNGFQPIQHRIAAARAILDYTHRKLPQRTEVAVEGTVGVRSIDAAALAKLKPEELAVLEKILEKVA